MKNLVWIIHSVGIIIWFFSVLVYGYADAVAVVSTSCLILILKIKSNNYGVSYKCHLVHHNLLRTHLIIASTLICYRVSRQI